MSLTAPAVARRRFRSLLEEAYHHRGSPCAGVAPSERADGGAVAGGSAGAVGSAAHADRLLTAARRPWRQPRADAGRDRAGVRAAAAGGDRPGAGRGGRARPDPAAGGARARSRGAGARAGLPRVPGPRLGPLDGGGAVGDGDAVRLAGAGPARRRAAERHRRAARLLRDGRRRDLRRRHLGGGEGEPRRGADRGGAGRGRRAGGLRALPAAGAPRRAALRRRLLLRQQRGGGGGVAARARRAGGSACSTSTITTATAPRRSSTSAPTCRW